MGSDLYAGHKVKNFFQPPKYAVSDRVEPRDSVLLCDVVPLRRGIRHLTCMALYSLLLMVSVTHQWSRQRSHGARRVALMSVTYLDDAVRAHNLNNRTMLSDPVQVLKSHLRLIRGSMILDHIRTRFLGGDLYVRATYTRVYTVAGYIPRRFTQPQMVTYPSINWARCRVTLLIVTNVLPLSHATPYYTLVLWLHC